MGISLVEVSQSERVRVIYTLKVKFNEPFKVRVIYNGLNTVRLIYNEL